MAIRYVALGPLLSDEGSRAFLGLRILDGVVSPCALVWVPEHVRSEPEQVELLRKETVRATALQHPNIVQVFGLIELDEGLARAVEFADGESLRRLLRLATRLPSDLAARVVLDAALGVQYAHLSGNEDGTPLVHGDVRPETVFISYSGVTKVSGYGALGVAPKEIGGRRVIGRRRHCAPEQILGGHGAVSEQTDVYLLGALLYELLTGEVPFQGEKDFDKAVVTKQPPLLDSAFVPNGLRPVIGKAMAKKGSLRFPTVRAFCAAVEDAAGGVAERGDVADFLEGAFKDDDARLMRRQEIERGIQEWAADCALPVQAPPESVAPSTAERPAPPALASSAPPPDEPAVTRANEPAVPDVQSAAPPVGDGSTPAVRSATPSIAAARSIEPSPDSDAWSEAPTRWRRKRTSPWVFAVPLVVVATVALLWIGRRGSHARSGLGAKVAQNAPSPKPPADPPPVASAQPSPSAVESPTHVPSPRADLVAPVPDREAARDREAGAAASAQTTTLEVTTTPALPVSLDGKIVGRAPVKLAVAPGKHRLTMVDPALGINLVRNVQAKLGENRLAVTVGRGTITINAPSGCEVRVDGRVMGTTPLDSPVTVFEGSHRVLVRMGAANWQQAFNLSDGEHMTFDVETEARQSP